MSGTLKLMIGLAFVGVVILAVLLLAVMGRTGGDVLYALVCPLISFVALLINGGLLAHTDTVTGDNIKSVVSGVAGLLAGWTLSDVRDWIADLRKIAPEIPLPRIYIATVSALFALAGFAIGLWWGGLGREQDRLNRPDEPAPPVPAALGNFLFRR